jgi:tetratricopeptide (TPR) repeat protein
MLDTFCRNGAHQGGQAVIERHGGWVLLLSGCALVAGGLMAATGVAQVGLSALGASLVVLAVVLTRTEGDLKIGPSGLQASLSKTASEEAKDVTESLAESGLDDLLAVAGGDRSLDDVAQRDQIRDSLSSLLETVERLDAAREADQDESVPAAVLLGAAHGLMADREWAQAARYFDRYVEMEPNNWDAQFSRAVAHANTRAGKGSDLASLRAYNDAIALRPPETKPNLLARLFSYRGAMLKRLGRLTEAEADLRIAEGKATETYERNDVRYNLACVLAMMGRRTESLQLVRSLQGTPFIGAIRANRGRYFKSLADDPEFISLLSPAPAQVGRSPHS